MGDVAHAREGEGGPRAWPTRRVIRSERVRDALDGRSKALRHSLWLRTVSELFHLVRTFTCPLTESYPSHGGEAALSGRKDLVGRL